MRVMYLIQYNVWNGKWQTLITVFAWLVMLKGLIYVFNPKMLNEIAVKKFKKGFAIYGLIAVVVGVYLFFIV